MPGGSILGACAIGCVSLYAHFMHTRRGRDGERDSGAGFRDAPEGAAVAMQRRANIAKLQYLTMLGGRILGECAINCVSLYARFLEALLLRQKRARLKHGDISKGRPQCGLRWE